MSLDHVIHQTGKTAHRDSIDVKSYDRKLSSMLRKHCGTESHVENSYTVILVKSIIWNIEGATNNLGSNASTTGYKISEYDKL